MSPEKSDIDITPDKQFVIDCFEKKNAQSDEVIEELRKKVKLLTGTLSKKGELDPWTASALAGDGIAAPAPTGDVATNQGSKRVREDAEGANKEDNGSTAQ